MVRTIVKEFHNLGCPTMGHADDAPRWEPRRVGNL